MGIIQILFPDTRIAPTNESDAAIDGQHNLGADIFLRGTSAGAPTPQNGADFVQHNYRSIPVCKQARGFTRQEANAIIERTKQNEHLVQNGIRAFNAMGRNTINDSRLHRAHRRYLGNEARSELAKVESNAQLGETLHQLRAKYAELGLSFEEQQQTADHRIKCLKAEIMGVLA